jgi:polar amino acid transport system permease protein
MTVSNGWTAREASTDSDVTVVPVRHIGRWIGTAVVLVVIFFAIRLLVTNPNFGWPVVWHYLFSKELMHGLGLTLELTAIAMAIGIFLGIVVALMRLSNSPIIALTAGAYIWFFRGTPVLVQLIFWYNLAALLPHLSLGVPFGGPTFFHVSTNSVITPLSAAILGLGLNEGAYMAEIVRGGIMSVGEGQVDAARSLGMPRLQVMRLVVLPQAMRFIIPPTGNETIGMLKTTSLVSVIALSDLLYSAQLIYAQNFQTIPLLIAVSLWYLAATTVLTLIQMRVERHFGRGFGSSFYGGSSRTGIGRNVARGFRHALRMSAKETAQ